MKHLLKSSKVLIIFSIGILALANILIAQGPPSSPNLIQDPLVRHGKLGNGMTYYIRKNSEPANRAELRLAVNAGSVLEDDDQQGLAHFVEHMAFNGSTHFEKSELVDALEGMGVKFGPHLNAYTAFDETVYMLQVPSDQEKQLDQALLVMEDWAQGLSFEDKEIDKERGVIIEEWRLRSGAMQRIMTEAIPAMLNGSKYAERIPIGKPEILKSFKYETLKRFYRTWYRPDLMAVIVVGDFDLDKMEAEVKSRFSKVPVTQNPVARPIIEIPQSNGVKAKVLTDKESQFNMIQVLFKHDNLEVKTEADYKNAVARDLVAGMITDRLDELKAKGDSPMLFGGLQDGLIAGIRAQSAFTAVSIFNPTGAKKALDQLLTELERARQHGFIESEFERQKTKYLKSIESQFKEREKTGSEKYAMEYVNCFLTNEPFPGIEAELELTKKLLPEIKLADLNVLIKQLLKPSDVMLMMIGVEKEGVEFPTEEEIIANFNSLSKSSLEPYQEFIDTRPLIAKLPKAGKILTMTTADKHGIYEVKLDNGVRVLLKPTNFKDNEIQMTAWSKGGTSKFSDSEFKSAWAAAAIIGGSGIGQFDQNVLQKKLAGKDVSVEPQIDDYTEGFYGISSKEDFETMLQLVYLYFTAPRMDKTAFATYQEEMHTIVGMMNGPDGEFRDTVSVTLAQHHPRKRPLTNELVDEVNLQAAYMAYLDRFQDASDFSFLFVGNFDPQAIKPALEQYLGSLPNLGRVENYKDRGISSPSGIIKREVFAGKDDKSMVSLTFPGKFEYSQENIFKMNAMLSVLRIMLRESMREEKGGVYGVTVNAQPTAIPNQGYKIQIDFGCAPARVEELIATVFEEIKKLKTEGASEKNLLKVQEIERRSRETDLLDNEWWISTIETFDLSKSPLSDIDAYGKWIEALNSENIAKTANQYIHEDNFIQVVLYPEKE